MGASYYGWFQNKYIHFMQFLFDDSKDIIKQVRSKFLHAHIIPSHNLFKKMNMFLVIHSFNFILKWRE